MKTIKDLVSKVTGTKIFDPFIKDSFSSVYLDQTHDDGRFFSKVITLSVRSTDYRKKVRNWISSNKTGSRGDVRDFKSDTDDGIVNISVTWDPYIGSNKTSVTMLIGIK